MMWIPSMMILVFVGGSFANECDQDKCDSIEVFTSYPENEEELLKICRNIQTFGNCILQEREYCRDDDIKLDVVRHAVDYLSSGCHEDNPTFKVISRNLQCMRPIIKSSEGSSCTAFISQGNINIINSHIFPMFEDYEQDRVTCLWALMDIKCQAVTLGFHCGEDVENAVEEILINLGIHHTSVCTREILEELDPFFEIFEEIIVEELQLQNEIDKHK